MLDPGWRDVRPGDAEFGERDALVPRFFLFSLKGYAYRNMRLGSFPEGRIAAEKLLELDERNRIGARVLLDVFDRMDAKFDDE